jgi:ABC-type Fe3+ transport system substrate-binding protein
MFNNFAFFFTFLVTIIASCGVEEANQSDKNELIIASDFLKAKDTTLFKNFSKTNNIRIKIKFLTADSIQKRLQIDGFNSNFDLVFVKSLQSVKSLKTITFHHLSRNMISESLFNFRAFQNNSWFAVGFDPYVFSAVPDTLDIPTSYKDLTKNFNYSCLNPSENAVLLAHVKHLTKKKPSYYSSWKKSFEGNYVPFNAGTDSLPSKQFLLLKWSHYLDNPILKKNKKRTINYTLNNSSLYADRKCVAVVLQAKNFKNASLFLSFLNSKNKSFYFYEKMGAVPILPKNENYKYDKIQGMTILLVNEDSLLMNL